MRTTIRRKLNDGKRLRGRGLGLARIAPVDLVAVLACIAPVDLVAVLARVAPVDLGLVLAGIALA
jgi:hypothetical protein